MKQHHSLPGLMDLVRVLHIDDDDVFLRCVKDTLEFNNKIEVVGQYSKARTFLNDLPGIEPFDILVIDYIMPEMNGAELINELRKRNINVPIISFTSHSFPEYATQLRKDGILHCLPKNQLKYLEALIIKSTGKHLVKPKLRASDELTADEVELLIMCCNNYSREEMSERLNIGVDAVKVRKGLLAKKLGIENRNINFCKWGVKFGYYTL